MRPDDETLLDHHRRAMAGFGRRVHAVRADQWSHPTPDTEWSVRDLVRHLVVEQLWVPPLLAGATIPEVGDRFAGDVLGGDPVAAFDDAAAAAVGSLAAPGALGRTVHLSYGDRPARAYCQEMTMDLLVHTWDLARAVGADESLDPELVGLIHGRVLPYADQLHRTGLFAPPVDVPDDAPLQTRLLALLGRTP